MFLHITFNRNQYDTFTRLFFYGVSKVDAQATTRFVKSLCLAKARQKYHALRTR